MTNSQITGPEQAELEEMVLLLENRTFVDYFNTFLSLPVFGQHVFYNFFDGEFEFEPPIKMRRYLYLDQREVLKWLCTERFRLFKKCPLYTEYKLCVNLRDSEIELAGFKHTDDNGQARKTFVRNVVGNATGMLLFRESLRGTSGEHVFRCWKDIEAWKLLTEPVQKTYWKHVINTQYINQNSASDIPSNMKLMVYNGFLNFDLLPDDPIHQDIMKSFHDKAEHFSVESDIALPQLQAVLLEALRTYWLPRHLLHIQKIASKDSLEHLTKTAPGDSENLIQERRLRCRLMFPASHQIPDHALNSSMTTVHTSKSALEETESMANVVQGLHSTPVSRLAADSSGCISGQIHAKDLLALWGGPAKEIEIDSESEVSSISLEKHSSLEVCGAKSLASAIISPTKTLLSPIPTVLSSYLGGKNMALVGKAPETTKRVIWCLASDVLACCPFRSFLAKHGHTFDVMYLNFWTNVRNYLDTDEHSVDGFGQSLRQLIAQRITDVYLSSQGEGSAIFSEHLKMSLYRALTTNDDVSLLCVAQNMVQQSLWQPLKAYIHDERKRFVRQVIGRRIDINFKTRRTIDQATKASRSGSAIFDTTVDPLNFFKCKTEQSVSDTLQSPPAFPATMPDTPLMSRPGTSYEVCIAEQRPWKAMEIAVLCCEYGSPMMVAQYLPTPEHLVDVLYSDDGSLHRSRTPAVRNEWLRSLQKKPKLNIETLRVSRKVLYERPVIPNMLFDEETGEMRFRVTTRTRMCRRMGLEIERPSKPKSFMEVLLNEAHFDFFKRFMIDHKTPIPLRFWRAVEDFREVTNVKVRQIRIRQILSKFFGKFAKYGDVLECHEEIIQQIPNMARVTPGILFCAQAAVARSMERKWFPLYLETYPPDSKEPEGSKVVLPSAFIAPPDLGLHFEKVSYGKRKKGTRIRARIQTWKKLVRKLVEFTKAISSKTTVQLFEMFLKFEVEREKVNPPKEQDPKKAAQIEKKMMMSNVESAKQTRMVVRNRLIIMNRVPADLRFWVEVKRYQDLVDLVGKANLQGHFSEQFTEILKDKGNAVIDCFLNSDIKPKVQVNISNELAAYIIQELDITGPSRSLFHDAKISLFPILFHFYQRFNDIWMSGDIPDDYMDSIEHALIDQVATTPHGDSPIPDLNAVNKAKLITTSLAEDMMGIHFSLSDGVRLVYPVIRVHKPPEVPERRMTKAKLVPYELAGQGDNKDKDGRITAKASKLGKGSDVKRSLHTKMEKRKSKKKLVVKEQSSPDRPSRRSLEKARKLNLLVETINREKESKFKEQNKKFSKLMTLKDLVNAALLSELPEDGESKLSAVDEGTSVVELL